jgi:hypothetical protein
MARRRLATRIIVAFTSVSMAPLLESASNRRHPMALSEGTTAKWRPKAFVVSAGAFYMPALQAGDAANSANSMPLPLARVAPAPQRRRLI